MRLISDRIVSCASCDCEILDLLLNSLELLLRHLFSVGQLESTTLFLDRI